MCCLKWGAIIIIGVLHVFGQSHASSLQGDVHRNNRSSISYEETNEHIHNVDTVLDTVVLAGSSQNASVTDKVNYTVVPDFQPNKSSTLLEPAVSEFKYSSTVSSSASNNPNINGGSRIYPSSSPHSNQRTKSSSDYNKQSYLIPGESKLPTEEHKFGHIEPATGLPTKTTEATNLNPSTSRLGDINIFETTVSSSENQSIVFPLLVSTNANTEEIDAFLSAPVYFNGTLEYSTTYNGSDIANERHKPNKTTNTTSSSQMISSKTSVNGGVHRKDDGIEYSVEHNTDSNSSKNTDSNSSEGVDILLKHPTENIQKIPKPKSVVTTRPEAYDKSSSAERDSKLYEFTTYHPNEVIDTAHDVSHTDLFRNVSQGVSHPCARTCVENGPPMDCHYKFELEWYYTMSKACYDCPINRSDCDRKDCIVADGVKRPVAVVNRTMPGPSIEVCKGDRIIVDMENYMMEESTTIHWHGHHQRGTPYMDGVPFVTQCPIPPKSSFRYHYIADTPGTHFWHSHSGCQRADGVFGALIIRVPQSSDPHSQLYDVDLKDHIIQILDWDHKLGVEKFLAHHHANGDNKPRTLLVNGRGRFHQFEDVNFRLTNVTYSPTATFTVQQGFRYRFRLINAGFLNCPIEMSVDNHTILVISSDGADIKPVEADSLVTYAGERFDFILNANRKVDNYWIRFRGLMDCDERFTKAHQVAVLHYEGASEYDEPSGEVSYEAARRKGLQVNSLNVGTGADGSVVVPELEAMADDDETLKEKPDLRFYLSYDFYELDNPHYHRYPYYGFKQVPSKLERLLTPQLNYISLKLPPFPLLSQYKDLGSNYPFCNGSNMLGQNCLDSYCECLHVIEVPLGAVLELILIDKGKAFDANHPFHLHGHAFRVIAMQRLGNVTTLGEVIERDEEGLIHRKLSKAPIKDTVTVPDGGFTIVRVHASNPGYWLFHCHIEFHVELGMAVVFKVGRDEDFPPVPPGFPRCNSYLPAEKDLYSSDINMDNEVFQSTESSSQWSHLKATSSSESSVKILLFPLLVQLMLHIIVR